jgi:hypothetical protein
MKTRKSTEENMRTKEVCLGRNCQTHIFMEGVGGYGAVSDKVEIVCKINHDGEVNKWVSILFKR